MSPPAEDPTRNGRPCAGPTPGGAMATPLEAVPWIHGAPNCRHSTDPLIQVHQFDEDTFILRLSKCFSFEGNFIYLLFGDARAIMFDTGARPDSGTKDSVLPIRSTVDTIVTHWLGGRGLDAIDLVVAHTHSHGDHVSWDQQFGGRPRTTVVKPTLSGVTSFFHLPNWPDGQAGLDLGGRNLTVLPIPGHETSHIATYDPRTKSLLTGDMLYPGQLTVQDWPAYRRSAARLASFAEGHDVSRVLGSHIEMTNEPRAAYPVGTTFQPDEHPLPLEAAHITELHAACEAMGNDPHVDVLDDFIIRPLN
jgi:hydroxyacylglutathione hydrolase